MERDYAGMDRIHIQDIHVRCVVGINPDERIKKRDVIVNVTLYLDLGRPGKTDDISDTVDYSGLKKRLFETAENSEFFLIERLAEELARVCLEDGRVDAARVEVHKPGALRFARSVGVEIFRSREDGGGR